MQATSNVKLESSVRARVASRRATVSVQPLRMCMHPPWPLALVTADERPLLSSHHDTGAALACLRYMWPMSTQSRSSRARLLPCIPSPLPLVDPHGFLHMFRQAFCFGIAARGARSYRIAQHLDCSAGFGGGGATWTFADGGVGWRCMITFMCGECQSSFRHQTLASKFGLAQTCVTVGIFNSANDFALSSSLPA